MSSSTPGLSSELRIDDLVTGRWTMCDLSAEVAIPPGPYSVLISRNIPPRQGLTRQRLMAAEDKGSPSAQGGQKNPDSSADFRFSGVTQDWYGRYVTVDRG